MPNRRQFIKRSVAVSSLSVVGGLPLSELAAQPAGSSSQTAQRPLIISTWPFGKAANDKALQVINDGGSPLDGVEQGIRVIEASGNLSVGLSGKPNAAGFQQLDACIMHGPNHGAGSVAGIEGIPHPISAARRVMEKTPHVMLVGRSARSFAISEGLASIAASEHDQMDADWWKNRREVKPEDVNADNHDTVTVLILGADGTISGGCSTSGLSDKIPGRVGDSPIIGGGLYVDNEVGAAGATGIGENVMRHCATFMIVEFMRNGMDPTSACQEAIKRIAAKQPADKPIGVSFIALDKQGRFGAAGTADFPHAVTYPGFSKVITAPAFGNRR